MVVAQAQSTAGDALLEIAAFWYIAEQTGSSAAVGYLAIVMAASGFLGSVFGGAYVDRRRRARTMVVVDVGRVAAATLAAFCIGFDAAPTLALYAAGAVMAMLTSVHTAASRALLAELESDDALVRLNSTLAAAVAAVSIVGFVVGAGLYAVGGLTLILALDATTFLIGAAITRRWVLGAEKHAGTNAPIPVLSYIADVRDGFGVLRRVPVVGKIILISVITTTVLAPINALGPALVSDVLNAPVLMLGIIEAGVMTGRVIGSLVARRNSVREPVRTLGLVAVGMAAATSVISLLPTRVTVPGIYLALGIGAGLSGVVVVSGIHLSLPGDYHGRVFGSHRALLEIAPPGSIILITSIADAHGPRTAYGVTAAALLGCALAAIALGRHSTDTVHSADRAIG